MWESQIQEMDMGLTNIGIDVGIASAGDGCWIHKFREWMNHKYGERVCDSQILETVV